jgi:hypothetical protein
MHQNERGESLQEDGMLEFDMRRVRSNVRSATTEDLLDRLTVYRSGMEPEALKIIEEELRERGVNDEQIDAHAEQRRRETTLLPDGTAVRCSFCHRPAVAESWSWHRLWGLVPILPRYLHYCSEHIPNQEGDKQDESLY